ncbi:hypothetical protein TPAR_05923 [Tolypocladium paradoxum]|uniref:Uncharacterized protein n=1 Tax=Tolypocladium paradoxum TaxID=94208 RepID=A0A2S4KUP5_9HYPO|nr:hypothetical protein TPAR_05923 [Tolypocladium paradoxum]
MGRRLQHVGALASPVGGYSTQPHALELIGPAPGLVGFHSHHHTTITRHAPTLAGGTLAPIASLSSSVEYLDSFLAVLTSRLYWTPLLLRTNPNDRRPLTATPSKPSRAAVEDNTPTSPLASCRPPACHSPRRSHRTWPHKRRPPEALSCPLPPARHPAIIDESPKQHRTAPHRTAFLLLRPLPPLHRSIVRRADTSVSTPHATGWPHRRRRARPTSL